MLKRLVRILMGGTLALLANLLPLSPVGASPANRIDIQEGNWSFTTLIVMSGFPGIPPRTLQFDDCLTRQHLVPLKAVKNCAMSSPAITGNTLSYRMHCATGNATGRFTYEKKGLTGLIVVMLNSPGNPRIEEHITGRYLAPCRQS